MQGGAGVLKIARVGIYVGTEVVRGKVLRVEELWGNKKNVDDLKRIADNINDCVYTRAVIEKEYHNAGIFYIAEDAHLPLRPKNCIRLAEPILLRLLDGEKENIWYMMNEVKDDSLSTLLRMRLHTFFKGNFRREHIKFCAPNRYGFYGFTNEGTYICSAGELEVDFAEKEYPFCYYRAKYDEEPSELFPPPGQAIYVRPLESDETGRKTQWYVACPELDAVLRFCNGEISYNAAKKETRTHPMLREYFTTLDDAVDDLKQVVGFYRLKNKK
jgi:hypothetical protein